jgi:hypothetical protein
MRARGWTVAALIRSVLKGGGSAASPFARRLEARMSGELLKTMRNNPATIAPLSSLPVSIHTRSRYCLLIHKKLRRTSLLYIYDNPAQIGLRFSSFMTILRLVCQHAARPLLLL